MATQSLKPCHFGGSGASLDSPHPAAMSSGHREPGANLGGPHIVEGAKVATTIQFRFAVTKWVMIATFTFPTCGELPTPLGGCCRLGWKLLHPLQSGTIPEIVALLFPSLHLKRGSAQDSMAGVL